MTHPAVRAAGGVIALAVVALWLHGYHFGVEDHTLYVPAVAKALDPTLFPHDGDFILTEARFTVFDEGIAWLVRGTALPIDVVFAGLYVVALVGILLCCGSIAARCLERPAERWAGLLAVVILLPFPVAGTRLALVEPYLHPRGLAIGLVLTAFAVIHRSPAWACATMVLAAVAHPLIALWGALHVACQLRTWRWRAGALLAVLLSAASCNPVSAPPPDEANYWRVALAPERFNVRYPWNWPWYEWAGVLVPLAVLAYVVYDARRDQRAWMVSVAQRLLVSSTIGVALALALTWSPDRTLPLQPMRQLHLVYFLVFLFAGALIERRVLKGSWLNRVVFFGLLALVVFGAQRRFPASAHIEWPGGRPSNSWAQAFAWAGEHTPKDALFALDPFYLRRAGPDSHSFRALAQRSMLSEAVHDLAPAAMSPTLGRRWLVEQEALARWSSFTLDDFAHLATRFGVDWIVIAQPHPESLDCPYENAAAAVCRIPGLPNRPGAD